MTRPGALALAMLLLGCQEVALDAVRGDEKDCSLALIATDYASTSVALLNRDGTLCVEPLLHSGSASAGVVTALSGDVVLPSHPSPDGRLLLIDRYPNAVLTWIDTETNAVAQTSVATGFASNPHDALTVLGELLVTRSAQNPSPGQEPFDGGGDVLILSGTPPAPVARIGLEALADSGFDPKPSAMAPVADDRVAVGLAHLSRDFAQGGPGRLAVVDASARQVVASVALEGLTNCGSVTRRSAGAVVVVCSGVFQQPPRRDRSALLVVSVGESDATVSARWDAESLAGDALAFGTTLLSETTALVPVFGDLGTGSRDRLIRVDLDTGDATDLGIESAAFELGSPFWVPADRLLLVPDADRRTPRLLRYRLPNDTSVPEPLEPLTVTPQSGLPPRHLGALLRTFRR
ncbi:MAG: hypothetical protein IV100_00690 [Myxococcales bacterium]|nr:hypothetical protein [Myxococcales bacterium]